MSTCKKEDEHSCLDLFELFSTNVVENWSKNLLISATNVKLGFQQIVILMDVSIIVDWSVLLPSVYYTT